MRKIIISEKAFNELKEIADYLQNKFSLKTKNNFIIKTEKLLLQIQVSPEMFPKSKWNKYHKAVIVKQVSLFYHFNKNNINIVSVFDTRQNPNKLKKTDN